jgi:hypothetical protein
VFSPKISLSLFLAFIFQMLIITQVSHSQDATNKIEKFGKALCKLETTGYVAVARDKLSGKFIPVKFQIVFEKKRRNQDLKLIKKLELYISLCAIASAPQSKNMELFVPFGEKYKITIPISNPFLVETLVTFQDVPNGVTLSGDNPSHIDLTIPSNFENVVLTFQLSRLKNKSSKYTLKFFNSKLLATPFPVKKTPTFAPTSFSLPTLNPTVSLPPLLPTATFTPFPQPTNVPTTTSLLDTRIEAKSEDYTVKEASSISITLKTDLFLESNNFFIVSPPTIGTLTGNGRNLNYTASHKSGQDSFTFFVENNNVKSNVATITITTEKDSPDFSGHSDLLIPYRENITEVEAVHLCNKISFGCPYWLIEYGVREGLTKFVDYLLTYRPKSESEINTFSDKMGPGSDNTWHYNEVRRWWVPHLIQGNGVSERMALFWHDHFATSLRLVQDTFNTYRKENRHSWLPQHLSTIRSGALGSFALLYEAMHSDPAMLEWLDNNNNYFHLNSNKLFPNENYSRETLELFSMGAVDFFTGIPNYNTDTDVKEFTRSFTGFNFQEGSPDTTSFFSDRWDPGVKTLFIDSPYEVSNNFNFINATEAILYSHPGTSRNIAGKLVRVLALPNPSEPVVSILASQLISEQYRVLNIIKRIAKSSMMFSKKARYSCVASPVEHITRLLRILEVPLTKESTVNQILVTFDNAGQRLLDPTSVFGWRGCGVGERGTQIARGELWLGAEQLLERQKQLVVLLDTIRIHEFNSQKSADSSYLDKLKPRATATPLEIVNRTALLLGVSLTPLESSYIVTSFMNQDRDNSTRDSTPVPWKDLNQSSQREKLAGLVLILMQHPKSITY